jgi:hypothetical protein
MVREHGPRRVARFSWRSSERRPASLAPETNKGYWIGLAFMIFLITEAPLQAYLDPGSGSMLVQLLLGGAAGIGVILKLTWQRLRMWLKPQPPVERGVAPDD